MLLPKIHRVTSLHKTRCRNLQLRNELVAYCVLGYPTDHAMWIVVQSKFCPCRKEDVTIIPLLLTILVLMIGDRCISVLDNHFLWKQAKL